MRDAASAAQQHEPRRPESGPPDLVVGDHDLPDERRNLPRALFSDVARRPVHGRLQHGSVPPPPPGSAELRHDRLGQHPVDRAVLAHRPRGGTGRGLLADDPDGDVSLLGLRQASGGIVHGDAKSRPGRIPR